MQMQKGDADAESWEMRGERWEVKQDRRNETQADANFQ